jgi:hypothetical protein
MDPDERRIEAQKLRRQSLQIVASFLGPLVAVAIAFVTIGAQLSAQAEATRNQLLAQTGSAGECKRLAAVEDGFWTSYDTDSQSFCEEWFREPRPPSVEVQRELVQQLVDHPDRWQEIAAMWKAIYPNQPWVEQVLAAFLQAEAS